MLRNERPFIGLFLLIAMAGFLAFASDASAQTGRRDTYAFSPPNLSLVAEPAVVTAVCPSAAPAGPGLVQLSARVTSNYPVSYRWTTNAGRIEGNGATVSWDLSGVQPGYYRAYVDINTGSGDSACQAFSSIAVLVKPCVPPPPVCPNVRIRCPERPVLGQPLVFTSDVSTTSPGASLIYNWTVTAGRITEGQGTPTITVDTSALTGGQNVTAKLSMGGFPMDCSDTCTVEFPPVRECKKFDEFPSIAFNDEKARLDNYAIELQNDPTSTAYVIVYPGTRGRPGEVQRHTTRILDYLVNSRGVGGQRIVTLVGPPRDVLMVELWVCPQGATPPAP